MQFITPVHIAHSNREITHSDCIFCIGSCFAENIADGLHTGGFRVCSNPWGTMYNPVSVLQCLKSLSESQMQMEKKSLSDSQIESSGDSSTFVFHNGLWHAMSHHGTFSSPDRAECERMVKDSTIKGKEAFKDATVLIITLGTAWVYEMNGQVIANCHKLPADRFTRRRLSVEEVKDCLNEIRKLAGKNRHIIYTVSPIRHVKDGLHENQLSKATLLLAVEQMKDERTDYFPSYEIMLDELRDYRFYASDMLHPSEVAIDYIRQRFADTYFSADTIRQADLLEKYHLQLTHRPLHPESEEYRIFKERLWETYTRLSQAFPWIDKP